MKGRALAALAALAIGAPALSKSSQSGVYTAYAVQCAVCHGARLEGTVEIPGLVGKFVANWADRPLGDFFDYLARAMPQSSPGSLAPQDNARLVAFILRSNGAPAGRSPLPADGAKLQRIAFDAPAPHS
jgi:mono/diheme cytochrome c family protein